MASNFVTSTKDKKGLELLVEVRPSDGYFNATKMCDSSGKAWGGYRRNQKTTDFLDTLSTNEAIAVDRLVQTKGDGVNEERGTWVHRKVAIHLAMWISAEFAVFVVNVADRFLTGQLTTEESLAAASAVAQLFRPEHARVAEWHKQRDDGKAATKVNNLAIQAATGNRATGVNYAMLHDSVNWAATGRKTKQLRAELGIKGTPRDHMATPQLSIVAYVEAMGAVKVGEKRKALGADVDPHAAVETVGKLAYTAHRFTESTGGHDVPLLAQKPPTMEQLGRAVAAEKPNKRQRAVLEKAEMKPALALPAPGKITKFLKPAVPRAVPESELDLFESY